MIMHVYENVIHVHEHVTSVQDYLTHVYEYMPYGKKVWQHVTRYVSTCNLYEMLYGSCSYQHVIGMKEHVTRAW